MRFSFLFSAIALFLAVPAVSAPPAVPDTPFIQEFRDFYTLDGRGGDVRALAVDGKNRVWAATAAGIYVLKDGNTFIAMQTEEEAGPSFSAAAAPDGRVWIGAWNGLYHTTDKGTLEKVPAIQEPIGAVAASRSCIAAQGPQGLWLNRHGIWTKHTGTWANSAAALAFESDEIFWSATAHGVYRFNHAVPVRHLYSGDELLASEETAVAVAGDGTIWCGGMGGIDVYKDGSRIQSYTSREGLPNSDVRALAFHPDGTLWVCTALGAARLKDNQWSLRHGMRWLPSDDTRAVAFDKDGTAWVATAKGISAIRRRTMTLAEKADYYYDILLKRKVRDPWIVGISRLLTPGDVESSVHEDEDNDGEFTNHYMVMELFRHLVTGDPVALERAWKARDTMEQFQTITGTSGFIARTFVPVEWDSPENINPNRFHDRNRSYTAREIAEKQIRDPRMKCVEERWRLSADGKHLWKGDTSSDEMCGHFFGYFFFHEYGAKTEAEKKQVGDLAGRVMDYLMEGGFNWKDIDGESTRWGVWSPEHLLKNGDWRSERAINATELLAYLKITAHVTGNPKYEEAYRQLINDHGYLEYARAPKSMDPSDHTEIDTSLLVLILPALMTLEKDEAIREVYKEGLYQLFNQTKDQASPFYNFICAAYGVEDFDPEPCVKYLRDSPLDLIMWTVDQRQREDLNLVRWPELDKWQVDRLLPADERFTMRWDKNPYEAVAGDGGHRESTGVHWLLPYWMGRYFGFIEGAAD
ncbi:MAG TPA: two-component regulator propeller domain-containing protein [Candidatus Hydrogenedentes bacterium]|nr:two-component regulator propeller domain-containing protein [Candidatus Hydrogenedentota bacterium]